MCVLRQSWADRLIMLTSKPFMSAPLRLARWKWMIPIYGFVVMTATKWCIDPVFMIGTGSIIIVIYWMQRTDENREFSNCLCALLLSSQWGPPKYDILVESLRNSHRRWSFVLIANNIPTNSQTTIVDFTNHSKSSWSSSNCSSLVVWFLSILDCRQFRFEYAKPLDAPNCICLMCGAVVWLWFFCCETGWDRAIENVRLRLTIYFKFYGAIFTERNSSPAGQWMFL